MLIHLGFKRNERQTQRVYLKSKRLRFLKEGQSVESLWLPPLSMLSESLAPSWK